MEALNAIAGSAFVALVLSMAGNVWLARLALRLLGANEKQWGLIGSLTDGVKDNNAITDRALDAVERARA